MKQGNLELHVHNYHALSRVTQYKKFGNPEVQNRSADTKHQIHWWDGLDGATTVGPGALLFSNSCGVNSTDRGGPWQSAVLILY